MEHPFLDFLGPALVPELSSDVAAGSPGHIQLVLVPVAALGAFPHQLAAHSVSHWYTVHGCRIHPFVLLL